MKVNVKLNKEMPSLSDEYREDTGIIPITQTTELGDSLKELNKDFIDTQTRTSDIDLRARLHPIEISSILALDALVAFGVCPTKCLAFTRQKKRLSVSLLGKGRKEIVDIVAGKRDLEKDTGSLWSKMTSGFRGDKE